MANAEYLTAPLKTDRMPPGVPYIVGNEAAERFSYYGMNSILVIFMTKYLMDRQGHPDHMSPTQADAWYHAFVGSVFGGCCSGEISHHPLSLDRLLFWASNAGNRSHAPWIDDRIGTDCA